MLVFVLALIVAYESFFAEVPTAYAFPRLVSALMVVFCGINVIQLVLQSSSKELVLPFTLLQKVAPGVVIIWVYVLLAEDVGFYVLAWLVFFLIAFFYDVSRSLLLTAAISSIVVVVLYLLFSVALRVQVPTGILL